MKITKLTVWIFFALVLGVIVGFTCHQTAADAKAAEDVAGYFSMAADIFLRMIKMIIGPLVFATLVSGITSVGDGKTVGRIGIKALSWFITASFVSLLLGMAWGHWLNLGMDTHIPIPDANASTHLKTSGLNIKSFLVHIFPKSIAEAMANNEVLQILVFSLFFGFALNTIQGKTKDVIVDFINGLVHVMIKVTDYVMHAAPIGVFGAVAAAITIEGLGILKTYAALVSSFYLGLASLWLMLISVGYVILRKRVFRLMGYIREPLMIAFSTSSSEAAYPKTLEQLGKFGVKREVSSFVLPMGYAFNLDGSMMYQAFAMIFIMNVYGLDMSFAAQLSMLLVLMVSSKGTAGVSSASLVVVAATLPVSGIPENAMLLIMGIDVFLDMGRTATNVIGNSLATSAVAQWEGKLGEEVPEQS